MRRLEISGECFYFQKAFARKPTSGTATANTSTAINTALLAVIFTLSVVSERDWNFDSLMALS
jgi:hypothetical protein